MLKAALTISFPSKAREVGLSSNPTDKRKYLIQHSGILEPRGLGPIDGYQMRAYLYPLV